ncbi:MAG: hypothetical protein QW719_01430 [Candidatus Micrarchaeaceae archaeon]
MAKANTIAACPFLRLRLRMPAISELLLGNVADMGDGVLVARTLK